MNAGELVHNADQAQALASVLRLVRGYFPAAVPNLKPWRDDPMTREWHEPESIDLAFHFPGWSPTLECRTLLMQLRFQGLGGTHQSQALIGVLIRGLTFNGERWRIATIGNWEPCGPHLPSAEQAERLHCLCEDLFCLYKTLPGEEPEQAP